MVLTPTRPVAVNTSGMIVKSAAAFASEHGRDFEPLDAAEALQRAHVGDSATLVRDGCLRLWPHRHGTDGFFAAVWQRR